MLERLPVHENQMELFNRMKGSPEMVAFVQAHEGATYSREEMFMGDLAPIVRSVVRNHPRWSAERLETAVIHYRLFWAHQKRCGGNLPVPNKDVDVIWHAHILFMPKYFKDSRDYFGYILMHNPTSQGRCGIRCKGDGKDGGGIEQ